MEKYILTIDEGTTSARAILFNHEGECVSISQNEFNQYYPHPGWIEQNPKEIWATTTEVINKCKAKAGITDDAILAVAITNQRETSVIWDKNTGLPVYNAIVWGDNRTAAVCNELREEGYEAVIQEKTGLVSDPEFSATKVQWILDHVDGVRERAEAGDLLFSNIDGWILWNLTRGEVHATDYSNASRTMLYNIKTLEWDQELLDKFGIPRCMMPEVKDSSGHFGNVHTGTTFQKPLPIEAVIGDQQGGTFGQCCFNKGECKMTYGTAGVFDMYIGEAPLKSSSGLLTSIAWGIHGKISYIFEGVVFNAGSAIQYLRDELDMIDASPDTEYFAKKATAPRGQLYMLPMFSGLGAPYWNANVSGGIFGMTRGVGKYDLIRATMDSLGYQTRDMVDAVNKDLDTRASIIRLDGGAAKNDLISQFTADILGFDVDRPVNVETTAAGGAYMAGLSIGFWKDYDDIKKTRKAEKVFKPEMSEAEREALYAGWSNCVKSLEYWGDGAKKMK
ncbi:MAG: glycerol kinase GlpK [Eubacteriaceae bacterium]|nr:glycerol kinase GlpK [Eubacteriaceae bacterium]MDD4507682.1 glycerol kinase GlpK [Eubacteriaceae bacterium]